jgi:hypothetical protein
MMSAVTKSKVNDTDVDKTAADVSQAAARP